MNREQMIAWLTLEGYTAVKSDYWNGVHKTDVKLVYMYLDKRREAHPKPESYCDPREPLPHMIVSFNDLPDLELLAKEAMRG